MIHSKALLAGHDGSSAQSTGLKIAHNKSDKQSLHLWKIHAVEEMHHLLVLVIGNRPDTSSTLKSLLLHGCAGVVHVPGLSVKRRAAEGDGSLEVSLHSTLPLTLDFLADVNVAPLY